MMNKFTTTIVEAFRIRSKKILWSLVIILSAALSLELFAFGRMLIHSIQPDHETMTSEGEFRRVILPRPRGWRIELSTKDGVIAFSCELAGMREFAACFKYEDFMSGANARIEWFESPSNIFSGSVRRPVRIEFVGTDRVIVLGPSPHRVMTDATIRKAQNLIFLSFFYAALYFLVHKLNSMLKGSKHASANRVS